MNVIPFEGLEGTQKLPLCQKCREKPAVVSCNECGLFLCADCRLTHNCKKKDESNSKSN